MKGQLANVRSFTHHRSQFVSAACFGCQSRVEASSFSIQSIRFYAVVCYILKEAAKRNTWLPSKYEQFPVHATLMMALIKDIGGRCRR